MWEVALDSLAYVVRCCPSLVYICFPDLIECGVQPIIIQANDKPFGDHPLIDCFNQSTGLLNIRSYFMGVDAIEEYTELYSAEVANNFDNICRLVIPFLLTEVFCTGPNKSNDIVSTSMT